MKPFPALFYFACIILLGVRLRPLHHHSSGSYATLTAGASASALWWQKELDLWFGWTNDLVVIILKWSRIRIPSSSLSIPTSIPHLPLPTTTTGNFGFNFPWSLSLWKVGNYITWQTDGTRRNVAKFLTLPAKVAMNYSSSSNNVNGLLKTWPWSWIWTQTGSQWTRLSLLGWTPRSTFATFPKYLFCFGDQIRLVVLGTLTYVGLMIQYLITSLSQLTAQTTTQKANLLTLPQVAGQAAVNGPGQV